MILFGNYLLSEERKATIAPEYQSKVNETEVEAYISKFYNTNVFNIGDN